MTKRVRRVRQVSEPKKKVRNYYSFSQISMYLNCARKYFYNYVEQVPRVGINIWMMLGTYVHRYIEKVLTAKLKQEPMDDETRKELREELTKDFKDEIKDKTKEYARFLEVDPTTIKLDFSVVEVMRQFNLLCQQWDIDILPEFEPIAVEQKIETDIGGVPFLMFIDAVRQTERGEQVLDWKVTKKAKGVRSAQDSLQLSIYASATNTWNVAFGSIIRPAEGKEKNWKPRIQIDSATRLAHEVDWANEVVMHTAKSIQAGNFPVCSPENFLCTENFCDHWLNCRGKDIKKVEAPTWFGV